MLLLTYSPHSIPVSEIGFLLLTSRINRKGNTNPIEQMGKLRPGAGVWLLQDHPKAMAEPEWIRSASCALEPGIEPELHNGRRHRVEEPEQRNKEEALLAATRDSPRKP